MEGLREGGDTDRQCNPLLGRLLALQGLGALSSHVPYLSRSTFHCLSGPSPCPAFDVGVISAHRHCVVSAYQVPLALVQVRPALWNSESTF